MANKEEKEDDSRYEFNSVKFAHELMVDVLGALIPGALFLFCIILCIVFPIICYSTQKNNFGFLMKDGDWFWIVAFLSFLILSYVLGLIFYRADIKMPDKADIRREQEKKLKAFVDGLPVNDKSIKIKHSYKGIVSAAKRLRYTATLLKGEIKPLADALRDYEDFNKEKSEDKCKISQEPYGNKFRECCDDALNILNKIISDPIKYIEAHNEHEEREKKKCYPLNESEEDQFLNDLRELRKYLLCIMFPEAIANFEEKAKKDNEKKSAKSDDENKEDIKMPDDELYSNFPNNARNEYYYKIAAYLFPEIGSLPFRSRGVLVNTVKIVPLVKRHTKEVRVRWWRHFRFRHKLHQINNNTIIERISVYFRNQFAKIHYEPFNILMVSYLILHMQNESGCATERRCDFPYMSYYKYLLKRRLFKLLKYADWATSSARTKNHINKYKIDLQVHVPNAYAVIIKNESHIRMASSSWHVAKVIRRLSITSIVITFLISCLGLAYNIASKTDGIETEKSEKQDGLKFVVNYQEGESHSFSMGEQKGLLNVSTDSKENFSTAESNKTIESGTYKESVKNEKTKESSKNEKFDNKSLLRIAQSYVKIIEKSLPFIGYTKLSNEYLAVLFPLLILVLSRYILKNIPKFIHYQRLREIYFTLELYMRWEDAKEKRDEKDLHDLNIRRASVNLPPISSIESAKKFYH